MSNWISVDDEWPERECGKRILAFGGYIFEAECDQDGYWCNLGGDDFTHWMPAPEYPNNE